MSTRETDPADCTRPARFTDGLDDGVEHCTGEDGAPVELLAPRDVPLGGPRGMRVRRSLPQRARALVGAWCFLDFYGPDDVAATGGMSVARHPHTGLATVSWLFDGAIDHIDSAGHLARVVPGDVNLMNAGAGITHSEFSTADTTVLHGAQLWYALPDEHRFSAPDLHTHTPPVVTGPGYRARVFLGELLGRRSPVPTWLPLTGAELRLEAGTTLDLDVPAGHEHGVLAVDGPVALEGGGVPADHLAVVPAGHRRLRLTAGDAEALVLLIGGRPLGEQIVMWWNFVGRSHEEVAAWRERYQQEMGFGPGVSDEGGAPAGRREDGEIHDGADPHALQFGVFPDGEPAPLPAPALPAVRMRPRG